MSDVTTCRACGLPRFHGPAGYAGAQCLCQWKGATPPQMYDELMAKNAALEAENARLVREAKNDAIAYKAVLERQDELRAERDAALAQLAAIQGGMGEVVEVVGWRIEHPAKQWKVYEQRQDWAYQEYGHIKYEVQDLMTVAQHQRITAAMAAEVERLKELYECSKAIMHAQDEALNRANKDRDTLRAELDRINGLASCGSVQNWLTLSDEEKAKWFALYCDTDKENGELRAELAEVKGREAVATIEQREPYEDGTPNPCKTLRWAGNNAEDDFPAGTKLYALPPASHVQEGT